MFSFSHFRHVAENHKCKPLKLRNARVNYYCKAGWGAAQRLKTPIPRSRGVGRPLVGQEDQLRIKSTLAWVMLAQGVPIVYYGTEQNLLGHQPKAGEIRIQRGKRERFFCFHFGKKGHED